MRRLRWWLGCAGALAALPACDRCGSDVRPSADAALPDAKKLPTFSRLADEPDAQADAASSVDAGPPPKLGFAAGKGSCALLYGPELMPFRGPAALAVQSKYVELVLNAHGVPRSHRVPIGPLNAVRAAPKPSAAAEAYSWPGCVVAGADTYCIGAEGAVLRHHGGTPQEVGRAKPGTRLSAATLAGSHSVVGFLAARRTSEGASLEAFASVDGAEAVRISDEGSGATSLGLASVGDKVLALSADARAAMTPLHARQLAWQSGLQLSADVVAYVAGSAEPALLPHIAVFPDGKVWGLASLSIDTRRVGMHALPLSAQRIEEVSPVVDVYPAPTEPAPIASAYVPALRAGQAGRMYIVRTRGLTTAEREANAGAQTAVELGALSTDGSFASLGVLAYGKPVFELALAADSLGALWISYGDGSESWLERRLCN